MADSVEMQDIRGLEIDKVVKGFALKEYVFKSSCQVSSTSADHIRYYTETADDLTATDPSTIKNISPLSSFPTLEVTWTRNTSYIKKYAAEGFISMEDAKSADIDVLARSLLRLTRAVVKQVDADIWDVMSESQAPSNIQYFDVDNVGGAISGYGQWDTISGSVVKDLLHAKKLLADYGYNPEGATLFVSPTDYRNIMSFLIDVKGSSIPQWSSNQMDGTTMTLVGLNLKVSTNVTADYALVCVPQRATTWKSFTDTTAVAIEEKGIGTKIRVWELGIAYNTDPKAIVLIQDTQF